MIISGLLGARIGAGRAVLYQCCGVPAVLFDVLRFAWAGSSLKGDSCISGIGVGGEIKSAGADGPAAQLVQPPEVQPPVVQLSDAQPQPFLQQPLLHTKIESSSPGKRRWQQLLGGIVFGYGQQWTVRAQGLHLLGHGLKRAKMSATLSTRQGNSGGQGQWRESQLSQLLQPPPLLQVEQPVAGPLTISS